VDRRRVPGPHLASHHENVNFFGTITVDIDRERAALDTNGYRPPRATTSAPTR